MLSLLFGEQGGGSDNVRGAGSGEGVMEYLIVCVSVRLGEKAMFACKRQRVS